MRSSLALVIFRLALSVALAMSAALLVDYLRPLPAFCDLSGGCEAVRASTLGQVGPWMPAIGLFGFASLMALSIWPSKYSRLLLPLTILGGVFGALLLLVQAFVVGAFCQLCVVVDISALVATVALVVHRRQGLTADVTNTTAERRLWGSASLLAIAIPIGIGVLQPSPPVPREIFELWRPGKLNVVEMTDFQCPFCRRLHPSMAKVLEEQGDRVHFIRLNMPLRSHPQARNAARAFLCAEGQGRGEDMAGALFATRDLSPANCEKLAETLGLDLPAYRACLNDSATEARLEAQIARVRAAGFEGLPMVWVGHERLRGLQSEEQIREAFARASKGDPGALRITTNLLWGSLAAGFLAVGFVAWRISGKS